MPIALLAFLVACAGSDKSSDSGADTGSHPLAGTYVQDRWQLRIGPDDAATFETDCASGGIAAMGVVDGAFDVDFQWYSGGGASEPTPVPATLSGTVDVDTITAAFTADGGSPVDLVLLRGDGLQLYDCP